MTNLSDDAILGEAHVSKIGFPATFWDLVITQDALHFVRTSKASFFWAMFGLVGAMKIRSSAKKSFEAMVQTPASDKLISGDETITITRQDIASLNIKKRKFTVCTASGEKYTFNFFEKAPSCADGQDPNQLLATFAPAA